MVQRFQEDFEEPSDDFEFSDEPDKAKLFGGNIYDLDNKKVWGFGEIGERHPGACCGVQVDLGNSQLLKGTSQMPAYHLAHKYCVIEPCPLNKLDKTTWFRLEPRVLRLRNLETMHHDRLIGRLSEADFLTLLDALREFSGAGAIS